MRDFSMRDKSLSPWLMAGVVAVAFILLCSLCYPLSPLENDDASYYSIAMSLKHYPQAWLSGDWQDFYRASATGHFSPTAPWSAKPLSDLARLAFALVLPEEFAWMGIGNAAMLACLLYLLTRFFAHAWRIDNNACEPASQHGRLAHQALLAALLLLGGLQLYYALTLGPRTVSTLMLGLALWAYARHARSRSLADAVLLGGCLALMLASHFSTIPYIGGIVLAALLSEFLPAGKDAPATRSRFKRGLLMTLGAAVPLALLQLLFWMPLLWESNPEAAVYSYGQGFPYSSYWSQVLWVIPSVNVDNYSYLQRLAVHGALPALIHGPVLLLGLCGWLRRAWRLCGQGRNSMDMLLVIAPTVCLFWFILQKKMLPAHYALAPMGVYCAILALEFSWATIMGRCRRRGMALVAVVLALQCVHVLPVVQSRGKGILEAVEWLRAKDEREALALAEWRMFAVAGISVWTPEPTWAGHASGIVPFSPQQNGSEDAIRHVLNTDIRYYRQQANDWLASRSIQPDKPCQVFERLRAEFYYPMIYLGMLKDVADALPAPKISRKLGNYLRLARIRHEESFVYVYEIPEKGGAIGEAR